MKNLYLALLMSSFLLFLGCAAKQNYQVVGYLPSWVNWEVQDIDAAKLTILKYSFLEINNNEVILGKGSSKYSFLENLQKVQAIKQENPNLQLIVSVGGWGVDGFSQAASTQKSREIFARSVANFLSEYNFDGVDIDWEFPLTGAGGVIAYSPNDRENFVLLIEEIRNQLSILGFQTNKYYTISVAVGIGVSSLKGVDFKAMEQYVDYFGVMSYNLVGTFSNKTGSHVALYKGESSWSIDDGLNLILSSGINPNKLILGIAFYGRPLGEVEGNTKTGLYQDFKGNAGKNSASYGYIKENYLKNADFKVFFDKKTKATYAYNKNERIFVSYHDPKSIRELMKYMKNKKMGGVLIWEITQDDKSHTLLNTINNEVK
ncbi:MAG: glycoside hydrolase family 18 protein [Alphaproteobacteria bacterium]|jgi:GH18 family chitinase|nr:glycoside hydrolase family 18 protein [Alphaproteobacteria bacterium]